MNEDSSNKGASSMMLKRFLRRFHHHDLVMKTIPADNSSGDDQKEDGAQHSDLLIGEDDTSTTSCSDHEDDDLLSSNLPTEVHLKMLSYLDIQSLNVMMTTSKTWCSFLQSPDANQLWWKRCQRVWNLVPAPSSSSDYNNNERDNKEALWNRLKLVDDSHQPLFDDEDGDEQQKVLNLYGLLSKIPRRHHAHRQPTTMNPLFFGRVGRNSPLRVFHHQTSGSLALRIHYDSYNTSHHYPQQVLSARADYPLARPSSATKKKKKCLNWIVLRKTKKHSHQWNPFVSPYSIAGESLHTIHVTPRLVSYYEITVEAPPSPNNNEDKYQEEARQRDIIRRRSIVTPERQMLHRILFLYGHHYDHSIGNGDTNHDTTNYNNYNKEDCMAIGLAPKEFDKSMDLPGWDGDGNSFGYHSNTGGLYHGGCHGLGGTHETAEPFGTGDTVGMGVDYVRRGVFVTKNGKLLGLYFDRLKVDYLASTDLYPVIGMDSKDTVVVNYGGCGKPFLFDLADYCQHQQQELPAK